MIEEMVIAIETIFSFPNILFVLIGTIVGITFGALPGLGGPIALALLIPITFGMDSGSAMILFGSTLGGLAFGGSIPAILLNTPGMSPNIVTTFDGYPMAQEGRASEAIGVAATASALGAIFGIFVFILMIPVAQQIILLFAPPEFFWIAIFGLVIIVIVSRGHLAKGLVSGGVGLLLSYIGYYGQSSEYRFGLGTEYLWDGIQLIPALIGLFALAEVLRLARQGGTIAQTETVESQTSVIDGIKHVLKRPLLLIRSSTTGTLVGIIPGAGATIAIFIAYMQAVQTSSDPDSFGKGNPDGIIAAEAANDAKDGGALLPTVVFGIPGSPVMALLLGAFILHGMNPGEQMLTENLHVLFTLIFALLVSNILTSTLGVGTAKHLMKVTRIPVELLIPVIIALCLIGSFSLRYILGDVVITVLFGLIGYVMATYNYSRVAVVLALILGPLAERNFHLSLMMSDSGAWIFILRPISAMLVVLTVLSLFMPLLRTYAPKIGDSL